MISRNQLAEAAGVSRRAVVDVEQGAANPRVGTLLRIADALWDWSLSAGHSHGSEADTAGTKELIQVLSGTVTVTVSGETHLRSTGDAIAFPGDVAHGYANPRPGDARFSLAVFEPSVGTTSRTGDSHG